MFCKGVATPGLNKVGGIMIKAYARFRVAYAWLIDLQAHTLDVYALEAGIWRELGRFAGAAPVCVELFNAVTIQLDDLWAPTA